MPIIPPSRTRRLQQASAVFLFASFILAGAVIVPTLAAPPTTLPVLESLTLDYDTPTDPTLQSKLEALDRRLREQFDMTDAQTAVGLLDLRTGSLALVRPDREEYAASVAKIGILLAYFDAHPDAADHIDPQVEKELAMLAKISSNEMAAKHSRQLGLKPIQAVLSDKYHLYDEKHGGGLWVGKHYGPGPERYGTPVADNSHAATVRQVMRFFLWLEQGKLVSPAASKEMRKIFESPTLKHDDIKFVKALAARDGVQIIRKWGTWQDWRHDAAVITAPGRHYILVALTHHPKGDDYLESLAREVDDWLTPSGHN